MIAMPDTEQRIAKRYTTFAEVEVRGASPAYERLALAVATSRPLIEFLASLPPERQQPNLFFAAVRHVAGVPEDGAALATIVAEHRASIMELMLTRTTQTNEPGRCAVLLPALARLNQPIALLEVGASAGLCLLPDCYGYDYGRRRISPNMADAHSAPVFPCAASANTPLPSRVPTVSWRCGLDLNPLDITSATDMAWLQTLVWPGHRKRAERLQAAIEIARHATPRVVRGDLLRDLASLIRQAPADAELVIFHTAVLSYVRSQDDREEFAEAVRDSGAIWISNEAPSVFPAIAARVPQSPPLGKFLLAINGSPVAWTAHHGQSVEWFAN